MTSPTATAANAADTALMTTANGYLAEAVATVQGWERSPPARDSALLAIAFYLQVIANKAMGN